MVRQVIPLVVVLAIGTTLVGCSTARGSDRIFGLGASHQNLRRLLADAEARAQKAGGARARHAAATMSAERDSTRVGATANAAAAAIVSGATHLRIGCA